VLVSKDATVKLIDCDSFQIRANDRSYLCLVGVDTHTPPEMQGQPFDRTVRTANNDNFGLAVLIFQLLFMGRHPFSGRYVGAGEMPIDKAIREYRFAYGSGAAAKQMKQPPGTLSLKAVTTRVARLFELAFAPGTTRPTAREWIPALDELSRSLKRCQNNNGHHFLNTLSTCPWCEIEAGSGTIVFNFVATAATWRPGGAFSIAAIWGQIMAVQRPGLMPDLPQRSTLNVQPSTEVEKLRRAARLRMILSVSIVSVFDTLILLSSLTIGGSILCLATAVLLGFIIALPSDSAVRKEIKRAKKEAESRWRAVEERWRKAADSSPFDSKLQQLDKSKEEYQRLPGLRNERLRKLESERRQRQLYRFLDRFRIEDARPRISGIGPSRTATLQSYGVETAADINLKLSWRFQDLVHHMRRSFWCGRVLSRAGSFLIRHRESINWIFRPWITKSQQGSRSSSRI
jgi:DNA-binding helix-hairpin-helix protein with protein kinase domain